MGPATTSRLRCPPASARSRFRPCATCPMRCLTRSGALAVTTGCANRPSSSAYPIRCGSCPRVRAAHVSGTGCGRPGRCLATRVFTLPHLRTFPTGGSISVPWRCTSARLARVGYICSLNHGLWLHRPVQADQWLHVETNSPAANAGCGLSIAKIHDAAGDLVASASQQTLMTFTG
ncbi:hypothetical protein ACRS8P_01080 [Burkholderia cenocepacia]